MTRRTVITGSASGIGRALRQRLLSLGEEVIGVDLHDADVCADLSTPQGRASAVARVLAESGGQIDALVPCAGVSGPITAAVTVNYFGVVELATALRPALATSRSPRLAVISSIVGGGSADDQVVAACGASDELGAVTRAKELIAAQQGYALYPSSKRALSQWVRRTAVAPGWADTGIALNAVAPGIVRTAMTKPLSDDPAMREVMERAVPMPLNGWMDPEVVAKLLAWLISVDNSHVTGQVIYIDGGADAVLRPEGAP